MHQSTVIAEQNYEERNMLNCQSGADVLQQIVCSIKISRAPITHDSIDLDH